MESSEVQAKINASYDACCALDSSLRALIVALVKAGSLDADVFKEALEKTKRRSLSASALAGYPTAFNDVMDGIVRSLEEAKKA